MGNKNTTKFKDQIDTNSSINELKPPKKSPKNTISVNRVNSVSQTQTTPTDNENDHNQPNSELFGKSNSSNSSNSHSHNNHNRCSSLPDENKINIEMIHTTNDDNHNGLSGKYISNEIADITGDFWRAYVDQLSNNDRLEVACTIGLTLIADSKDIKNMYFKHSRKVKMQILSLSLFDKIAWFMRHIDRPEFDLFVMLSDYHSFQKEIGFEIAHFQMVLTAMNECFTYHFESQYTIVAKYCLNQVFLLFARIITNTLDLTVQLHKNDENDNNESEYDGYISSLKRCLLSTDGREYFYRYLNHEFCDNICIFLQLHFKFQTQHSANERFMVARSIIKTCVKSNTSPFLVNLTDKMRNDVLNKMAILEKAFLVHDPLDIDSDFFSDCYQEVYQIIIDKYWLKFQKTIRKVDQINVGKPMNNQ